MTLRTITICTSSSREVNSLNKLTRLPSGRAGFHTQAVGGPSDHNHMASLLAPQIVEETSEVLRNLEKHWHCCQCISVWVPQTVPVHSRSSRPWGWAPGSTAGGHLNMRLYAFLLALVPSNSLLLYCHVRGWAHSKFSAFERHGIKHTCYFLY